MREQYKDSLWTPCKTLQYRKVFANAMVEETGIPCFSCGECQLLCVKSVYCRIYSLKSCITRSISSIFWREYSRAL